jgi:hypothetical protein
LESDSTRRTLHAVAELLLAGPQHAVSDTVRLRVTEGGIATTREPDVRLEGARLVGPGGQVPLSGTYAELAAGVGVTAQSLAHVYTDGVDVDPSEAVAFDPDRLAVLLDALTRGDTALRSFAPSITPVLWPEHLDVAITDEEVNYGVSPGDSLLAEPYAYVGPWAPRRGTFWNQPFGAARPLTDLSDIAAFFTEGAERAATDPPADS